VNVCSRFNRAGFTGTHKVLVSAVPSAGVDSPASLLGGPGFVVMLMMKLAPSGQIYCGVAVAVVRMSAAAAEDPVGESQIATDGTAGRA
jgi:hypothetical protein